MAGPGPRPPVPTLRAVVRAGDRCSHTDPTGPPRPCTPGHAWEPPVPYTFLPDPLAAATAAAATGPYAAAGKPGGERGAGVREGSREGPQATLPTPPHKGQEREGISACQLLGGTQISGSRASGRHSIFRLCSILTHLSPWKLVLEGIPKHPRGLGGTSLESRVSSLSPLYRQQIMPQDLPRAGLNTAGSPVGSSQL